MGSKTGEAGRGMQLDEDTQKPRETPIAELNFSQPLQLIAELMGLPDFPHCELGQYVDCGGYTGVVVQVSRDSIKVRSQEGTTRSYNLNGLRKLYGPRPEPVSQPEPVRMESTRRPEPTLRPRPAPVEVAPEPPAPREFIAEPNFDQPLASIAELVADPEFPKCAYGKLIDFAGFTGVVVEIVNGSIKVRSIEETTRSYNIRRVRELHGLHPRPAAAR